MKVDLVLLKDNTPQKYDWVHGNVICINPSVNSINSIIGKLTDRSTANWILFWNANSILPEISVIEQLISQPIDVWHSGLRMGTATFPKVMDYVDPTWMYNKNAGEEVAHTNFRLSFSCLLVKTDVIKKFSGVIDGFASIHMAGIALGYAMLKSGAIIRYTPTLLDSSNSIDDVPRYDEWVFAKKFYTRKWHWWLQFSMPGFVQNMVLNAKTRKINSVSIQPLIHPSNIKPAADYKTVSILAPTLDRYEYLLAELEQLNKQTILPVEVLITDQTPETRRQTIDIDKYKSLHVRYFPQNENGQCVAWNKLLQEAKGEYVLFLGDDADDITPDFIERLLMSIQFFNADMAAANVVEAGIASKPVHHYYYLSDTFPITLIKRDLLLKTGFMDMFYNRNIRADHDLAMRCHLQGALMVFNPSATIYHHRAPVGGLRAHKARVVTNSMVKKSLTKFTVPTSSEIYLVKKFYNRQQYKSFIRIKFLNQLFVNGAVLNKILKTILFIFKSPGLVKKYKQNLTIANAAINERTAHNR